MNVVPVIERELRAESRRTANFWLRVLAAGALTAVFGITSLGAQLWLSQLGPTLFAILNHTLRFSFWIIVPLMTADCISREKREGTLGLLFLTPLTVLDVILGKAGIHILRTFTMFLAALPILGLPFVLGGIGWTQIFLSGLRLLNAIMLSIGAGIYASTKAVSTIQVMALAAYYAVMFALFSETWTAGLSRFAVGTVIGFVGFVVVQIAFSLGLFILLLKTSIENLRDTWQQQTAAQEQPRWVQNFSDSEFWQTVFRWNKGRTLDRNPISWLQEYSWTARLTKWAWCFVLLLGEFIILSGQRASPAWQSFAIGAFALGVAFSAVWSFRREIDTGLLELLLVTPLTEKQLIGGRLWGIFAHSFPALAVLVVGCVGDRLLNPKFYQNSLWSFIFPNPFALVAISVLGLYLSLTRLNFLLAWLSTWLICFVFPVIMNFACMLFTGQESLSWLALPTAFQFLVIAIAWMMLEKRMRLRKFALDTAPKSSSS